MKITPDMLEMLLQMAESSLNYALLETDFNAPKGDQHRAEIEHKLRFIKFLKQVLKSPVPDKEDLRLTTFGPTSPRVETGPLQFGTDWPGVFIRGDEALYMAMILQNVIDAVEDKNLDMIRTLSILGLENLKTLLSSARTN